MDDKLSPEDRRRIQKGALLKKFADVKKNNFTAARLCVAMGMVGAHRFYLGQRLFGGLIAAVFGVLLILVLLFKDNPDYVNMVMILAIIFVAFWLFEIFRVSSETDKVNDRIRRDLESEFFN